MKPDPDKNSQVIYLIKKLNENKVVNKLPRDEIKNSKSQLNAVKINKEPVQLELIFPEIITDKENSSWDVIFESEILINEPRKFLSSYGYSYLVPGTSLDIEVLRSLVINNTKHKVRDIVSEYTLKQLKEKDTLPLQWWERKIAGFLEEFGIDIKLNHISWNSAEYDNLEEERFQRKTLEKLKKERKWQNQLLLEQLKAEKDYEDKKERIKFNKKLSHREREHRLEILEEKFRKSKIEARQRVEEARYKAGKEKLEHEKKLAELRNDVQQIKEKNKELKDAEEEYTEKIYQYFIQFVKDKLASNEDRIILEKSELKTRDIMGKKVNILKVNSSLQIEFTSDRSGYTTLINIGTSGRGLLHVPNEYTDTEDTKIKAKQKYKIPGSKLLPVSSLKKDGLDYVEAGPPGWEHLIIIVSDKPLNDFITSLSSSRTGPFYLVSQSDLRKLIKVLNSETIKYLLAGHLSFKVE